MAVQSNREWRFQDDLASEPRPVPTNWLDSGSIEPLEPGERRTFAILMRIGTDLEWSLQDGAIHAGPHRDRPAVEVLYATVGGAQAHATIVPAEQTPEGVRPESFTALASVEPDELSDVELPCRALYRALIEATTDGEATASTVLHAWRNDGLDGLEEVTR
jgi:hypothetical protein